MSVVSPTKPTPEGPFQWPTVEDDQGLMLVRQLHWPLPLGKPCPHQTVPTSQPSTHLLGFAEIVKEPPQVTMSPTPSPKAEEVAVLLPSPKAEEAVALAPSGMDADTLIKASGSSGTCPL